MENKVYVGSGKKMQTKYGEMFSLSFSKDDLKKMGDALNEKGYVKLNMNERKEVDKYGNSHYMCINDWKPEKKQAEISMQDIPF